MRILQTISSAGYYGAEAMLLALSGALAKIGCEVVIALLDREHRPSSELEKRAAAAGLETVSIRCSGRFDRSAVGALRSIIRKRSVRVVQTHGYKADIYGYLATRGAATTLLATCHNWTGGDLVGHLYDLADRLVLRRFPHVTAVSEEVRRSLRRYGVPARRITVIPNGIDTTAFRPDAAAPAVVWKQGRPAIGLVGRLVLAKGGDRLLRAAVEVLRVRREATFLFIGDGSDRAELEALSRRLGVAESVVFTGCRPDMPAVYAALDIVVLPSRNEGMPMTVIEAMAAGRPVIATKVGALPQVIDDGLSGLLVDEADEEAFTRALLKLAASSATAAAMGERARARAIERFSAETMARRYLELYWRLCLGPAL